MHNLRLLSGGRLQGSSYVKCIKICRFRLLWPNGQLLVETFGESILAKNFKINIKLNVIVGISINTYIHSFSSV